MPQLEFGIQVQKYWFHAGILFTLVFAMLYPSLGTVDGPLKPEMTIPYVITPLIYLLTLQEPPQYNKTITVKRNIAITLILCYIINPVVAYGIALIAKPFGANDWILKGFISTSCMPPPLASGLVLCAMNNIRNPKSRKFGLLPSILINSNHELDLSPCNDIVMTGLSNISGALLGCIATPIILYLFIGVGTIPVIFPCLISSLIAALSLAVGYYCPIRTCFRPLGNLQIAQTLVLFSLYCNMCEVFKETQAGLQATEVLQSLLLVFSLQLFLFLISRFICRITNNYDLLSPMIFSGTHKSVTLGFPMMQTMFGGLSHHALFSLPLLLHYATQMFIGILLIQSGLLKP